MTYQRKPHQTAIGPMSKNSENLPHYIAPRVDFAQPERITSFAKGGTYSQKADWANSAQRPGCMDAYSLPSLGFAGLKKIFPKQQSHDVLAPDGEPTGNAAAQHVGESRALPINPL